MNVSIRIQQQLPRASSGAAALALAVTFCTLVPTAAAQAQAVTAPMADADCAEQPCAPAFTFDDDFERDDSASLGDQWTDCKSLIPQHFEPLGVFDGGVVIADRGNTTPHRPSRIRRWTANCFRASAAPSLTPARPRSR